MLHALNSEDAEKQDTSAALVGAGRASQVALVVKNPPANAGDIEIRVQSLDWENLLEEGMEIHSSTLALRNPWTEESGSYSP